MKNKTTNYISDIKFYKLLKGYFIVKNQFIYFKKENSFLSKGKTQELKKKVLSSLYKFNKFITNNKIGDINDDIKFIKKNNLKETVKYGSDYLDKKIDFFKNKYQSKIKNSFFDNLLENRRLKKIAKLNYKGKYKSNYNKKRYILNATQGYLYISPAIVLISVFMIFSIIFGLYMSFNKVKTSGFGLVYKFVGFEQYKYIFKSESFRKSLEVTLMYMVMVAPIQTLISLILSSVLQSKIKGKKLFTILYFLPTLTSSTALTLIFLRLFGNGGPMTSILGPDFVNKHILGLVAIMNIWTSIPYFLTIYNAAHADIPKSQYEAASIDGASSIKKFIKITIPYLRPITAFVLLTSIIWTLQTFDQLYIIGKDPTLAIKSERITSTAKWIYDMAFGSFRHQDFGRAAAGSIILAAIIFIFALISNFLSKGNKVENNV